MNQVISVETTVRKGLKEAWTMWTDPKHVTGWNFASNDWYCPHAENDLKPGGKFSYRMEARNGSFGFDFWGVYTTISPYERIESILGDGRKVTVTFKADGENTLIKEDFEAESRNTIEQQRMGWQAILDNFSTYSDTR